MVVSLKSTPDGVKRRDNSTASRDHSCYGLLIVPIILFLVSLYIPPTMVSDSGVGFLALRNMFGGGAFNTVATPDPTNIANDVVTFLTYWSPGQYILPGLFIWLGTSYGLAVSLTTVMATLIGVAGWIQVARSFAVSPFVLSVFVLGLSTFPYVTDRFLMYWGGELLLFATAPWSLYAMRFAANKPAILCFTVSLLSATVLFFAKLTGLVVFATNVAAISLLALAQRRLNTSTIAMWVASAIAALCFMMFWVARGPAFVTESTAPFSWFLIWFSMTAAAFSGIYGLDLFFGHPWMHLNFQWAIELLTPLGLLLMGWVWYQLRLTPYRNMAALLLSIILIYAIAVATALRDLRGVDISFEDRHFRYAGILCFLLLLTAVDQWRQPWAKSVVWSVVIVLVLYSLRNYTASAYAQMRAGNSDAMVGISQDISPAVLEYMRSEVTRRNLQRPIAVIPSSVAAISIPKFRIILTWDQQLPAALKEKWAGRVDKIFVLVQEEMLLNGQAQAILRSFTNYDLDNWSRMKLDGMIIYTQ
jgi:hypothetical protein